MPHGRPRLRLINSIGSMTVSARLGGRADRGLVHASHCTIPRRVWQTQRRPARAGFHGGANQVLNERLPIPKGLRPKAQGCEARATLGVRRKKTTTPTGLRLRALRSSETKPRWGFVFLCQSSQGSSFLATLGFVAESRWDSYRSRPSKPDLLPAAAHFAF